MNNLFQALVSSSLVLGLFATANAEPTSSAERQKKLTFSYPNLPLKLESYSYRCPLISDVKQSPTDRLKKSLYKNISPRGSLSFAIE